MLVNKPYKRAGAAIVILFIIGALFLRQSLPGGEWTADDVDRKTGTGGGRAKVEVPVPARKKKMVVMASTKKEDTSWTAELADSWDASVYHVDDPTAALTVPKNKGNEAMSYLTYLIDNYDNLPEVIAFVHPHKDGYPQAWHTDADQYSNVNSLRQLKIDFLKSQGYVNLRCIWIPGCPAEIQPFRTTDKWRASEHVFIEAWEYMFGKEVPVPKKIGAACCSQFAVTGEQVRKRPKAQYERIRQWLLDTELLDEISGRVMEYIWHILFGKQSQFCPEVYQCRCDVYGRDCNRVGLGDKLPGA